MFKSLSTIGKPFFAALGIIIVVCVLARLAFAQEPSVKEKAAADLPRVIQVIEETQPAALRNEQARIYKAQLLGCIEQDDCDVLKNPMNDSPLR